MKRNVLPFVIAGAAVGFAGATAAVVAKQHDLHVCKGTKGPVYVYNIPDAEGNSVRVMSEGGVYQSATYLDPDRRYEAPFEYLRSFDRMFEADLDIKQVLMIGGGGFAYPKHMLSHHPDTAMVVAEIDPKVIQIALKHFFLYDALRRFSAQRLGITNEDGFSYLRRTTRTFDAIINDAYDGAAADNRLGGASGAMLVKSKLNPGGLFLSNVVAELESDSMAEVVAGLSIAFNNVYVIPCIDEHFASEGNYLVIATDGTYDFSDVAMQRMRLTSAQ